MRGLGSRREGLLTARARHRRSVEPGEGGWPVLDPATAERLREADTLRGAGLDALRRSADELAVIALNIFLEVPPGHHHHHHPISTASTGFVIRPTSTLACAPHARGGGGGATPHLGSVASCHTMGIAEPFPHAAPA